MECMKMKMIEVLVKLANEEIKEGTLLKIHGKGSFGEKQIFVYKFREGDFRDAKGWILRGMYSIDVVYLNEEVELLPPREEVEE